jgi:hypothetical protein
VQQKKRADWLLKASRPDDQEVVQQAVDWQGDGEATEVVAVREMRRRPAHHSATPLRSERRVTFGEAAKWTNKPGPRPEASPGPAPGHKGDAPALDHTETGDTHNAEERQRAAKRPLDEEND